MEELKTHYPRIIQIMPAPAGMKAVFVKDGGDIESMPVMCLALMEDRDGDRLLSFVRGMVCFSERDGFAEPEELSNFIGYDTGENIDWRAEGAKHLKREGERKEAKRQRAARS